MLEDFYDGKLNLSRLNYGVIVLIPKTREVVNIKQFRPIYLLNVFYKLFTKILASRLMEVVDDIISENQTTFIKGRNILEGVLILHEVIHELNTKKQSRIILKLDFKKAYDKLHWGFLEEVLILKEFPDKWVEWIKQAVQGGRVSINVNNEHGRYFRTFKDLRQGDPLSLLLFNLVVDALSALLEAASRNGRISGLVPHLVEGGLTHLQYVDDTVVMIQMEEESMVNLKLVLYCFESMSEMEINYHKSEVFVIGGGVKR
jgi:hypothetical protein